MKFRLLVAHSHNESYYSILTYLSSWVHENLSAVSAIVVLVSNVYVRDEWRSGRKCERKHVTIRCMALVSNPMSGWGVFRITGGKRCADILQFSLTESRIYRAYWFNGTTCSILWLQSFSILRYLYGVNTPLLKSAWHVYPHPGSTSCFVKDIKELPRTYNSPWTSLTMHYSNLFVLIASFLTLTIASPSPVRLAPRSCSTVAPTYLQTIWEGDPTAVETNDLPSFFLMQEYEADTGRPPFISRFHIVSFDPITWVPAHMLSSRRVIQSSLWGGSIQPSACRFCYRSRTRISLLLSRKLQYLLHHRAQSATNPSSLPSRCHRQWHYTT